jgi:glycosyltransferase involved in cell wall biosynthesis
MQLAVALLAPFAFPSVRGNAVTVERIARGLRARGLDVALWDLSATSAEVVERQVRAFRPAALHAFHAYRTGPVALRLARSQDVPLVVTITGTDGNHDLVDPTRAAVVRGVLETAAAVTVFHESMAARLRAALPDLGPRLSVVPQSVSFEAVPDGDPPPPDLPAAPGGLLLFPGGIRPVKNPRFPLEPLDGVVARRPGVRLAYVGPVLDPAEGEALRAMLAGRPWARTLGAVPHWAMPAVLRAADVVLNCSESEGGMANSVLEALALGRAVLAADIAGNRSLIEDGVTGLLYATAAELAAGAERLLADPALRRRLGEAGRARVGPLTTAREADRYLAVYRRLMPVGRPA